MGSTLIHSLPIMRYHVWQVLNCIVDHMLSCQCHYQLFDQNRIAATAEWRVIFILTPREWIDLFVVWMVASQCLLLMLNATHNGGIQNGSCRISNFHAGSEHVNISFIFLHKKQSVITSDLGCHRSKVILWGFFT